VLASDFLNQSATVVGLMAGGIAVGGFLGHARPSLSGDSEMKLRRATTRGGLAGLCLVLLLIICLRSLVTYCLSERRMQLSEVKAQILAFIGLAIPFSTVTIVILATSRSGVLLGLTLGLFAALGGWVSGGIVMRYSKLEERRKREEIILSR
jgi:hypothetical protein